MYLKLFILFGGLLMSTRLLAMDMIPANSNTYYPLGGGSDISIPPVTNQQDITLGGHLNSNLSYSCTFNPAVSIANTISHISDSIQGIQQNVIASATGAVASLPMYLLSKSNKDLYNLIQNTMTGAEDTFHLSEKSCQSALTQIRNGKSPYQQWFSLSDSQGWLHYAKAAKQGQSIDVNTAKKQLAKNPAQYGVPWVHPGQNSGGTYGHQVPIRVIYDVVVAGYNVMVDPHNALDDKTTQAAIGTGLVRYWKTADTAGQWARLVLGDITISSHPGVDQTTRGTGLMTLVQLCPLAANNTLTCAHTIASALTQIIHTAGTPSAQQLRAVSSDQLMATPALIEGIRNLNPQGQTLAISKWSQDVALQNIVGEALLLRRVLIAGSQTKSVHNLTPALTAIHHALAQLQQDIENILFQFQVRKTLMTQTAQVIIGSQQQSESQAINEHTRTQTPAMAQGAIYTHATQEPSL
jgi:integrating conjugative element protein (TIGR03755 family)